MRGAPFFLILVAVTAAEAQQQGSVQLSTDTQILQGSRLRRGTERTFEPDFGALWTQPGSRFGQFQLEMRATRRSGELHLGRTWLALRDARYGGVSWTFEGGDLYTNVEVGDSRFTNLSAPAITFAGASVSARTSKTNVQLIAGRSTAWRNIFGTDPDTLGQTLGLARATHQATRRLQLTSRAARIRTTDLAEFTRTIDASDQGGGGLRFTVTPAIHLVGEGAFVRYRATGATASVNDYSYLAGAHFLAARGWLQVNASRYSPGDMPVLNASLRDRSGIFSAGEYDVFRGLRLFAGWESIDTNIQPSGTALLRPVSTTARQFGGLRVRLTSRSSLALRVDEGDRLSKPAFNSLPVINGVVPTTSDTGSLSAELQSSFGRITAFGRFTQRENVDSTVSSATYTQRDGAAQLFVNLSRQTQLFGVATVTDNQVATGEHSTYLTISAGAQQQLFQSGPWVRVEGSTSRNHDLTSGLVVPRSAVSVGLNGQIAPHTTLGLNIYADRAPVGFPGDPQAWLTRSTVRLVHAIPTGSVRVANSATPNVRSSRGTGSVTGSVFADWNANGHFDTGEEVLGGIPVALGTISHVTTGRDGQFSFLNVPAGAQLVRLDLNALPVDFDAPATTDITIEIARGESRRLSFGLLPLGGIHGRVYEDANRNGVLDAGEPPVDGAVVVLDGGLRSELARKGQFRFDAVRAGDHRLELLKESLPEGAAIVGETERRLSIARETPQFETLYLVTIDKRPEIRRVFPPRGGGGGAALAPSSRTSPRAAPPNAGRGAMASPTGPRPSDVGRRTSDPFTVQVAALTEAPNAREVVDELKALGFDAYLVEPGEAGGLYRVRVGTFTTRASAQRTVTRLESHLGLKLWVTKKR